MAYNKKEMQTKLQTLGSLMEAHKYSEAWSIAGEINSIFKANKDTMTGTDYEAINSTLRAYYAVNKQVEAVNKRAYAMGKKAQEIQL